VLGDIEGLQPGAVGAVRRVFGADQDDEVGQGPECGLPLGVFRAWLGIPLDEVDGDGAGARRNVQGRGAGAGVGVDVLDAGEEGGAVGQVSVGLRGNQQVLPFAAGERGDWSLVV
jgi:hypothetical protein